MERLNSKKAREHLVYCPKCRKTSTLYLSSKPNFIVLNCPTCHCTLINNSGQTFIVDDLKISQIDGWKVREIIEILKGRKTSQRLLKHVLPTQIMDFQNNPSSAVPGDFLSRDDILNLKISLELCRDVQDFIKSI